MSAQPIAEVEPVALLTLVDLEPKPQPVTHVDANASMWRLRSLLAMGHNAAVMAEALGTHPTTVRRIILGRNPQIGDQTARRIESLWHCWWDLVPPTDTLARLRAFTWARGRAAVNNWPTPANLDEERLETPGYRPWPHWLPASGTGVVRDFYPLGRWSDVEVRSDAAAE